MNSIIKRPRSSIMLMFRYFTLFLLLLACGGEKSKTIEPNASETRESKTSADTTDTNKTILFFGDSLTAGYGLDDNNDAFPAIIQTKIDALGLGYTVVNSGVSGETSSGGLSRIAWVLNQNVDIFVLELGANDGLRGILLKETRENLQAIIDTVRKTYPDTIIILAGMQLPPNLGQDYTQEFRTMFSALAETNDLELIPFLLQDVGGIPELNLEDGIHPNIEGHKIVANNVWEILEGALNP